MSSWNHAPSEPMQIGSSIPDSHSPFLGKAGVT